MTSSLGMGKTINFFYSVDVRGGGYFNLLWKMVLFTNSVVIETIGLRCPECNTITFLVSPQYSYFFLHIQYNIHPLCKLSNAGKFFLG